MIIADHLGALYAYLRALCYPNSKLTVRHKADLVCDFQVGGGGGGGGKWP